MNKLVKYLFFAAVVSGVFIFGQNFTYSENLKVLGRSPGALPALYTLSAGRSEINDFLIQDVCVDDKDQPVAADPYTCAKKRDLRIGEDMPYLKYARRSDGMMVSVQNSYPVWGGDFPRVVRSMNHHGSKDNGRDYNIGDGYDVIEGQGEYASIMGTRDPVTTDENFVWFGKNCKNEDGWMLFPKNILTEVRIGEAKSEVVDVKGYGSGAACKVNQLNKSFTYYARVMTTFFSGKKMEALKTFHFAQPDPKKAGSFEVFLHTRIYGLTRWEAWKDEASCIKVEMDKRNRTLVEAKAYCQADQVEERDRKLGMCNGPSSAVLFGKRFLRTACVDNTFVILNSLPLHAYATPLTTTFAYSRNLLTDSDFASGKPGVPWNRTIPDKVSWNILIDANRNHYLSLERNTEGRIGVQQTANVGSWKANTAIFNVGALINGPSYGYATISLDLYGTDGKLLDTKFITVATSGKWAPVRFYFAWPYSSKPVRKVVFKYLPETVGSYLLDEAFVALLPK